MGWYAKWRSRWLTPEQEDSLYLRHLVSWELFWGTFAIGIFGALSGLVFLIALCLACGEETATDFAGAKKPGADSLSLEQLTWLAFAILAFVFMVWGISWALALHIGRALLRRIEKLEAERRAPGQDTAPR